MKQIGFLPWFTVLSFLLSCAMLYLSPRLDWLTLLLFLLLFTLQALALYFRDQYIQREVQQEVDRLLHVLQDIEDKEEKIHLQNSPLGILADEILKSLVEKRESKELAVRARQLLKKNVEDITHQIKTPITGILLLLDLMKEDPDRQAEYLPRVRASLERLYRLADLLLKLSSLDAKMVEMRRDPLSAVSLINDAEGGLAVFLEQKDLTIEIKSPDISVTGDRTWLLEAISNILKNAVEASPARAGITVRFTQNQIYRSIFIQDQGKGIPPQQQKHIFERFYKADPESDGFGIGLPLVKSIMEAHDGAVFLQSDGNGSSFELRFYTRERDCVESCCAARIERKGQMPAGDSCASSVRWRIVLRNGSFALRDGSS